MKLRIKGNSIRLRLTQAEVQRIAAGQTVQEHVSFGSNMPTFTYSLEVRSDETKVTARYQDHIIRVNLPAVAARTWATTEQVSIEETLLLSETEELHLLVEKDFQCLHPRPNEDEQDHFPNPAVAGE